MALFRPALVVQALEKSGEIKPQAQWRNPVMFIFWIESADPHNLSIAMASGVMPGNALFSATV